MKTIILIIGKMNLAIGRAAAPLTLVITVLVLVEVTARYFLNSPTTWSNEVNQYLLCALVMFGGGYTLRNNAHTRVDILSSGFSERKKALVEIFTGVCVLLFSGPIVYFGFLVSWEAFAVGQNSVSAAQLPLWPSMVTVPLGALFLALQGLANSLGAIRFLTTGHWDEENAGRI